MLEDPFAATLRNIELKVMREYALDNANVNASLKYPQDSNFDKPA